MMVWNPQDLESDDEFALESQRPKRWWTWLLMTAILMAILSVPLYWARFADLNSLADLKKRGEVIVLTRNGPTTYYEEGHGGGAGPEFELVSEFARTLGIKARFVVKRNNREILEALKRGEGDMAAAGLALHHAVGAHLAAGPSYQEITQQLVCRSELKVKSYVDLAPLRLVVLKEGNGSELLNKIRKEVPTLVYEVTEELSSEEVFDLLMDHRYDCTIVDSSLFTLSRRYYTQLEAKFNFEHVQQGVWLFAERRAFLRNAAIKWHAGVGRAEWIASVWERYAQQAETFDYYDAKVFQNFIDDRLKNYQSYFQAAGQETKVPWPLLASIAYQESQWNSDAVSPTGVRGVMMLTRATAKSLGIDNRVDPQESIRGGARYFQKMLQQIPTHIQGRERIKFALAAYNVGYAHLRDARSLAVQLEKDPNRWSEVAEVLPLLAQKRYYAHLPHGFARGEEPVRYVKRIETYHDLLLQRLAREERPTTKESALGARGGRAISSE